MFDTPFQGWSVMLDFKPSWVIVGGCAIDLYLEKVTRHHEDIEIAIFRQGSEIFSCTEISLP